MSQVPSLLNQFNSSLGLPFQQWLPEALLEEILALEEEVRDAQLWCGRHIKVFKESALMIN